MPTLAELQNLEGKNLLVLGGAGYLGKAASEVFAELGGNVIISSRSKNKCNETAKSLIRKNNQNHFGIECDITDEKSVDKLKNFLKKIFKKIDVIVICVWNGKKNSWKTINQYDWDSEIEICLNSNFRVIKSLQNLLARPAKIILVSSMYGIVSPNPNLYEGVPQENPPSYGVAKAGVIQFSKYLAAWLAKDQVTVNCISPGPFPFPETKIEHPEFCRRLEKQNPCNRIGLPDDLKGVFALLATQSSEFITGQNISVDGGWTIW